jgi:hypothetical protein
MNSHKVSELLQLLAIAHHVPGRVRLKLLSVEQALARGLTLDDVERLTEALCQLEGVRAVKLNSLTHSCLVEYDPSSLTQDTWAALLSGNSDSVVATALLQQLHASLAECLRQTPK